MLFNRKHNNLGLSYLEVLLDEPRPSKKSKRLNPALAVIAIILAGGLLSVGGLQMYSVMLVNPYTADAAGYLTRKLDTGSVTDFKASSVDSKLPTESGKEITVSYNHSDGPNWSNFMGRFNNTVETTSDVNPEIVNVSASSWSYNFELKNYSPSDPEDQKVYGELILFFEDLVKEYPFISFSFTVDLKTPYAPKVKIHAIDNWTKKDSHAFSDLTTMISKFSSTMRNSKSYVPGVYYTLELGLRSDRHPAPLVVSIPFLSLYELDELTRTQLPPVTVMGLAGFYFSTQSGTISSMVYHVSSNSQPSTFNIVIEEAEDPTKKQETIDASHNSINTYWSVFVQSARNLPYKIEATYGSPNGEKIITIQE